MTDALTTVLLVEDDPADAELVQRSLAGTGERTLRTFRVEWVKRLSDAIERLGKGGIEVVLLDLALPDGQGLKAFNQVFQAAPYSLILLLCAAADEETARLAVQRGASDYLVKGHVDAHWLPRALRYLLERRASRDALRASELRFRAMSDASPLGIFVSDVEDNCVYTNAAYHKISGLTVIAVAAAPDDERRSELGGGG